MQSLPHFKIIICVRSAFCNIAALLLLLLLLLLQPFEVQRDVHEMRESVGTLFFTPTGGITPATFLLFIGFPLILSGRFVLGILFATMGMISALREAMREIKESEKQEIRYNIVMPEDIVAELEILEESKTFDTKGRTQCLASLAALAKKHTKQETSPSLPLLCQEAAYLSLRLYPDDDEIVAGAISLLALIAKKNEVRQRNKNQADKFGLDRPIQALQKALERAKKEEDETHEELLAEIQRKGALFLGALADGDQEFGLPIKIVEEDGLELILDAANWFRLHEDVANWTLWASFIICFENVRNKVHFVRLAGITTVCELMKNNPNSLEVNRHGVAILFDLLREGNEGEGVKWDPWEVRRIALGAGLHDVILSAMNEFSDSMDVMMMGQEMLIGTGYAGDIPQIQQF